MSPLAKATTVEILKFAQEFSLAPCRLWTNAVHKKSATIVLLQTPLFSGVFPVPGCRRPPRLRKRLVPKSCAVRRMDGLREAPDRLCSTDRKHRARKAHYRTLQLELQGLVALCESSDPMVSDGLGTCKSSTKTLELKFASTIPKFDGPFSRGHAVACHCGPIWFALTTKRPLS